MVQLYLPAVVIRAHPRLVAQLNLDPVHARRAHLLVLPIHVLVVAADVCPNLEVRRQRTFYLGRIDGRRRYPGILRRRWFLAHFRGRCIPRIICCWYGRWIPAAG